MTTNIKLSIVIPVYNEEKSLAELYTKLNSFLDKLSKKYEIIFVDDGSTDNSLSVLKKISKKDNAVKIISFRKNFGKGAALSEGFSVATGEFVITLDADLQDEPNEIKKLLDRSKYHDVVVGWKKDRKDPLFNVITSRFFNKTNSLLFGIRLHDVNCGLKLYKRKVIEEMDVYGDLYRFLPILAHVNGFLVGEVVVNHKKRKYGRSKYGPKKILNGVVDIITVYFLTKFKAKPGHFFSMLGLVFLSIGIAVDGYVAFLKILTGTTQGKIPLLIFGVLMIIVGVQLISLGLLGELIVNLSETKKHPKKYSKL